MTKHEHRTLIAVMPVGALCGFLVATVVTYAMPKVYESEAVIEVRPLSYESSLPSVPEGETPKWLSDEIVKMKSRESLDRVIDRLGLEERWNTKRLNLQRELEKSMKIVSIRGSDLVSIRLRHTDKVAASDIAMMVAQTYTEYRDELQHRKTQQSLEDLNNAIKDQEKLVDERILVFDALDKNKKQNIHIGGPDGPVTLLHLFDSQEYLDAKWEKESAENLLTELKLRQIGEDLSSKISADCVPMHQEATIGESPVSPNLWLNLVIGMILGFLLSPVAWWFGIRK